LQGAQIRAGAEGAEPPHFNHLVIQESQLSLTNPDTFIHCNGRAGPLKHALLLYELPCQRRSFSRWTVFAPQFAKV